MKLKEYFESRKGRGVISTANKEGDVNSAIYATPHFMEEGEIAFIMRDRLTHKNVVDNPKASYLFVEDGAGVSGIRLYLEKVKEEVNTAIIDELSRRKVRQEEEQELAPKYLVYFIVTKILPLIGDGDPGVEHS